MLLYCLCHKPSGPTDTDDAVGASEWFQSSSLGSLLLRSSSASWGPWIHFQIAFAALPLSCSTVPNWPARANNKWDLHTVTSATAGFAQHIGHTFLMIKAVKFTEHLLLVERKKETFFFFVLLVFSSFTTGLTSDGSFWWLSFASHISGGCLKHRRQSLNSVRTWLSARRFHEFPACGLYSSPVRGRTDS